MHYNEGDMRKWFHITFSTYGSWLPGDARGFRSWRHRVHSSGDYKNPPPPGEHEGLRGYAQARMTRPPVTLTREQRRTCVLAMVEKLQEKGAEVLAIPVGARHVHVQARIENHTARKIIGLAKQTASHRIRDEIPGTIWAGRSRTEPITNKNHQQALFHYIVRHRREGAFVWTFRDWKPTPSSQDRSSRSSK